MTLNEKFKAVLDGVMPPMFLSESEFSELKMRVFDAVALKTAHSLGNFNIECSPTIQ